jgi:hypothetical protein
LDAFLSAIKDKVVEDFAPVCEPQNSIYYFAYFLNPTFLVALVITLLLTLAVAFLALLSLGKVSVRRMMFVPLQRDQHKFERVNLIVSDMNDQLEESVFEDGPSEMAQKLK